jgi:hypothetical protein
MLLTIYNSQALGTISEACKKGASLTYFWSFGYLNSPNSGITSRYKNTPSGVLSIRFAFPQCLPNLRGINKGLPRRTILIGTERPSGKSFTTETKCLTDSTRLPFSNVIMSPATSPALAPAPI